MPKPYSIDLRRRVVDAIEAGLSLDQAAKRFDVGVSTARRWSKRSAGAGDLTPAAMGGDRRSILESEVLWFAELVKRRPAVTPGGALHELKLRGIEVSYSTVRRFMVKHGWRDERPARNGAIRTLRWKKKL